MNTETKHTPGPYAYDDGVVYADHGLQVHVAYTKGLTDRPDENGQLFAAAPDLLEALHAVDEAIAANPDVLFRLLPKETRQMIDNAIAKAEGRS